MLDKKQAHSFYFLAYVLLAVLIVNSLYLSYKYLSFYYAGGMLSSFDCSDDCDSVMMSEYSMFMGIPVPVYGLFYFLAITVFFSILTNYKSEANTWMVKLSQRLILADHYRLQQTLFEFMLIIGCSFALWFLYVLYFKLQMICKFCLISHSGLISFTLIYFFLLKRFNFNLNE